MPSHDPSPLVVHAPGALFVATDELLAHLPVLTRLADEVEADGHRAAWLSLEAPSAMLRAELDACERRSFELADRVRRMRTAIAAAELAYSAAERSATAVHDVVSDWAAALLLRPAARLLLPWLALGGLAMWHLAPGSDEQKRAAIGRWMLENPQVITSPEFTALVGRVVSGADDFVLGDPLLMALLGEHGLGLMGAGTSAAVLSGVAALAGTSVLTETPVRVRHVASGPGTPPSGAAERLRRVPDQKQVRIERYSAPGEPDRFIVYVAPTQTFSPVADAEPWDLTSNITGVAGLPSGSIRATEQAMAHAGIRPDSQVVLVGYSQGGLVADAIAGSGRWNVAGLETYGDPGGGVDLPDGIRGLAVRHSDDFIPATGGPQQPVDRVIVERRAFPDAAVIPTDRPAPAHQKDAYLATARDIDGARSSAIRDELRALDAFARDYTERAGGNVTTSEYRAERISGSS